MLETSSGGKILLIDLVHQTSLYGGGRGGLKHQHNNTATPQLI
ncbi:hypothetical protein QQ008_12250 [Fulvivirgaceae bacterium BMA10]|uniref:Uncharacterized protein n=1 Tax=Splendidivirga corallicola TaxID=3051826 RepID=A0ABT8KN62_9BACT|nr:hypothetical protein [Fulvivirgaceae bacterium BMA10]